VFGFLGESRQATVSPESFTEIQTLIKNFKASFNPEFGGKFITSLKMGCSASFSLKDPSE
jgi:hypothetical protein